MCTSLIHTKCRLYTRCKGMLPAREANSWLETLPGGNRDVLQGLALSPQRKGHRSSRHRMGREMYCKGIPSAKGKGLATLSAGHPFLNTLHINF